jgi:high-affinity nickel-transport protein
MQEGERPVAVGLFFSLGHSTVVLVGSMLLARLAALLSSRLAAVRDVGGLIGTLVSATFLFAIAVLNLAVLRSTWRSFRRVRRGEACAEQDLDLLLCGGGPMSRLFRSLFRLIRSSWAMYPLGLLFGLGFDTATEIGLLGISAQQASRGLPLWQIVVFPVLFAAGMSLVDTADNLLMLGAYGWALLKPVRKLYYNLTITALSVVLACVVGGLEILGLAGERLHRLGTPWRWIEGINDHFGLLGYGIVGLFVVSWIGSIAIYRLAGLEHPAEPQASLRPR